jgi:hypothetical protein
MKIKLSANSIEATEYLEKKHGVECNYAYSYGFGEFEDLTKDESWGLRVASRIDKIFSKAKPLPEEDRTIAREIGKAAQFLEKALPEEDHEHINGMQISVSLPSKFNSVVTQMVDKFSEIAPKFSPKYTPDSLLKISKGAHSSVAAIQPYSQKMIISSEIFTDTQANSFGPGLINAIGVEDTIKYVVFHEASHAFEKTNINKNGMHWDNNVSPVLDIASHYNKDTTAKNFPSINSVDLLNHNIKEQGLDFAPLDKTFLRDIHVLHGEIYADVGSILLNRNLDIIEGNYSKNRTENLISVISDARFDEQQKASSFTSNASSRSNHFTTPGLSHLKTMIENIPERVLSQTEINTYANECSKVGLARTIIATAIADPDKMSQLKTIFHTSNNFFDNDLDIEKTPNPDLVTSRYNALKETAGKNWFQQYSHDVKKLKDEGYTSDKFLWMLGVNKKAFEESYPKIVKQMKEIDDILSDDIVPTIKEPESPPSDIGSHLTETIPVKDKSFALASLNAIRNKSLNTSDSQTLKRKI